MSLPRKTDTLEKYPVLLGQFKAKAKSFATLDFSVSINIVNLLGAGGFNIYFV
jgi:hypothetical protein